MHVQVLQFLTYYDAALVMPRKESGRRFMPFANKISRKLGKTQPRKERDR